MSFISNKTALYYILCYKLYRACKDVKSTWCMAIAYLDFAVNKKRTGTDIDNLLLFAHLQFRTVGRSKILGVPVSFGGHNLPPPYNLLAFDLFSVWTHLILVETSNCLISHNWTRNEINAALCNGWNYLTKTYLMSAGTYSSKTNTHQQWMEIVRSA